MDKCKLVDESCNIKPARPSGHGEVNLKIRMHPVTLGELIYLKQM